MRQVISITFVLFLAQLVSGQDRVVHDRSTAPPNGRYEIVESPVLARLTFKLDRYAGRVWQLVVDKEDRFLWEPMQVQGMPAVATQAPRFQIFVGGRQAKHTFLLDSQSGTTWECVIVPETESSPSYNVWTRVPNTESLLTNLAR
jgi:hypothetical protein